MEESILTLSPNIAPPVIGLDGSQQMLDQAHARLGDSAILVRGDLLQPLPVPELVDAAARSRKVASDTLALFESAVLEHHAEEEAELFPAVLRSAKPGREHARVAEITERLALEHRMIEKLWSRLKPSVVAAAAGRAADVRRDGARGNAGAERRRRHGLDVA